MARTRRVPAVIPRRRIGSPSASAGTVPPQRHEGRRRIIAEPLGHTEEPQRVHRGGLHSLRGVYSSPLVVRRHHQETDQRQAETIPQPVVTGTAGGAGARCGINDRVIPNA